MKTTFKKVLLLGSLAIFSLTSITGVSAAFPDVYGGDPFTDAIEYVHEKGIVGGFSDGTYKPLRSLTRAEFTKILINAKNGSEVSGCTDIYFPDVPAGHQFQNYICVAKKNNIVGGFSDGSYKPDWPITHAEAVKIVVNAYGFDVNMASASEYKFKPWIDVILSKKALPPKAQGVEAFMTRDTMAEVIYRLEENITNKDTYTYSQAQFYRLFKGKVSSINDGTVILNNNECLNNGNCDVTDPVYKTFNNTTLEFVLSSNIKVLKYGSGGASFFEDSTIEEFKANYGNDNYVYFVEDGIVTKIQPHYTG